MRYAFEYGDAELNGAMTYTVRLINLDTKKSYRDGRFDLLDDDAALEFCRSCAADLAGHGMPAEAYVETLTALLGKKVAEVHRTTSGRRHRRGAVRKFQPFPTRLL